VQATEHSQQVWTYNQHQKLECYQETMELMLQEWHKDFVYISMSSKQVSVRLRNARSVSLTTQLSNTWLTSFETAVIAVMHGVSFGLALDMTLCADIRICVSTTRFAVKEVDIGLAADIGTLTRLPKANIPMSFIKDVALTARVFTAQEALTVGIVSAVYDTKAEALAKAVEKATLIASKSPVAIMGTKEVLNYSRDHSVADGKFDVILFLLFYVY
jgi:enoyl-CoA hydratase/carnithine racemase